MEELYKQLMDIKNINDDLIRSNDWRHKRCLFKALKKKIFLFEYDFISYYINHICERNSFNKKKLRSIGYFSNTFLLLATANPFEKNLIEGISEFIKEFFGKR